MKRLTDLNYLAHFIFGPTKGEYYNGDLSLENLICNLTWNKPEKNWLSSKLKYPFNVNEMNNFWQFIINTRDFCQQMSIKHYGKKGAGSEYKFNLFAFVLGYVITIIFIVLQAILYFYDGPILPLNITDPWYIKLLAGGVLFVLPSHLITRFLLKKTEHIPLPVEYNPEEYRKFIWVFWAVFLLGWVLWITIGIFLMSHLRGIDIK